MLIGLDFGTTNCAAARFDGERVHIFGLEPGSENPALMRAMLYVSRDQPAVCGQQAIEAHQTQSVERSGMRTRRYVGHVEMTFAETGAVKGYPGGAASVAQPVYALVDDEAPGRLLTSLKSELAAREAAVMLSGQRYPLERLIARILEEIRIRIEAASGQRVRGAVIGRPVRFSAAEGPEDEARAEWRLRQAAELAGFDHVEIDLEPVAAACAYAQGGIQAHNVFVFDFGGGTLDLTVMHLSSHGKHQVLSSGSIELAGDALDRCITAGVILDHLGRGSTWGPDGSPFPEHHFDVLLHWQFPPQAGPSETLRFLRLARQTSSHPARLRAFEALLALNRVPQLGQEVEAAKIALSSSPFTVMRLAGEEFDLWQPLTRSQFEALIGDVLHQVDRCVRETLAQSGLRSEEIGAVLCTGGSSQIPCVSALLERMFGPEKIRRLDPFTSVAAGLAIRAWQIENARG
jgi:hypothetical chaperone protein